MSVETITLGCRLNFAESDTIARTAEAEGDWIVVNSCAVTNEAVRQTRQAIRKAKRARPGARVVVTGCAAQIEPQSFAAMPEVARVLGNREKFDPASFLADAAEVRGVALHGAAGDDQLCIRPLATRLADRLPRLADGLAGHRTGVEHHRVAQSVLGGPGADDLALVGVQPAAEGDHLDVTVAARAHRNTTSAT